MFHRHRVAVLKRGGPLPLNLGRRGASIGLGVALAIAPSLTGPASAAIRASSLPACSGAWSLVPSPNVPGNNQNYLGAVSSVSASTLAVAGFSSSSGNQYGFVATWDGSAWTQSSTQATPSQLNGIFLDSSTHGWAVGENGSTSSTTLIEEWNGTAWSKVASPNGGAARNTLWGISGVSSNDIWAVGGYRATQTGPEQTLTEHWDGKSWSVVPSPDKTTSSNNVLTGVSALSATDAWAAGISWDVSLNSYRTLTEHWDGTSWSAVQSPNRGLSENILFAVSAVSPTDVWAVGRFYDTTDKTNRTLIERWNGTAWKLSRSPSPITSDNQLFGVSATSATNAWAVGRRILSGGAIAHALIEHWDGTSWSVFPKPKVGTGSSFLTAVSADSTADAWAVGVQDNTGGGGGTLTLAEQFC